MSRYTSHFVREEELGLVYQAVTDPRSPALIVTGPPGKQVASLMPSKLKAHLHQRVARLYLQSIESQVSITPPRRRNLHPKSF
jgi:hypothetical protein